MNRLLRPTVAAADGLRHAFFSTFGFDGQWTRRVLVVEYAMIEHWPVFDAELI